MWARQALGPVPSDPIGRADWEQRASVMASYREISGHADSADPIGPEPAETSPEAHAAWRGALAALSAGQSQEAMRAEVLDDELAYDGSNGPPLRPLEPAERALLVRVIDLVETDPRTGWPPGLRTIAGSLRGSGAEQPVRDLTARERDDLCRLNILVHGDCRSDDGPSTFRVALSPQDLRQLDAIASIIDPRQEYGPADQRPALEARWTAENEPDPGPTDRQLMDWAEHDAHVDGLDLEAGC